MRLLLSRTSATNRPDRRPSARPALRPGPFHPRQLKAVKEGGGRGAGRESRPKADLIPEGTDDLRLPTDQLLPTCPARQSTHKFLRRAERKGVVQVMRAIDVRIVSEKTAKAAEGKVRLHPSATNCMGRGGRWPVVR